MFLTRFLLIPQIQHIPWCSILTSLPVSAVVVAAFSRNYIFTLLVVMIPKYYKDMFGMPSDKVRKKTIEGKCIFIETI